MPTRTATPTASPSAPARDDVRTRVLDAALEVLQEQGIQELTQARVARHAGLRQSHLTYYFPTRSQLLVAVVERGVEVLRESFGPMRPNRPRTLAALRRAMAAPVIENRIPRLMTAMTVAAEEDPSLKQWLVHFQGCAVGHLAETLAHHGLRPPPLELKLFHATIVGVSLLNLNAGSQASARQARRLFDMAFDRLVAACPPVAATAPASRRSR
jgi:AcrR family transcriptional regulator